MSEQQVVIYEGEGEWSAVYLNGKLVRVGDHYLADEWVRDHFGVKTIQSDDFMRGGNGRDAVAEITDEIDAYRVSREQREVEAAELRAEAERLMAQAAEIESKP